MILHAIEKYGAALCALDAVALAECFAIDGEWTEPAAPPVKGPEGVRSMFEAMGAGFASMTLTPTKIYVTGPQDAAFTWVGHGEMKDGRSVDFHGINVMACDAAGKLTRVQAYWDPSVLAG